MISATFAVLQGYNELRMHLYVVPSNIEGFCAPSVVGAKLKTVHAHYDLGDIAAYKGSSCEAPSPS